ncbi:MAG: hypothetical protein ABMB14_32885, partial [Myxococcota bacterium]
MKTVHWSIGLLWSCVGESDPSSHSGGSSSPTTPVESVVLDPEESLFADETERFGMALSYLENGWLV